MKQNLTLATLAPLLRKPYFTSDEAKQLGIDTPLLAYYIKKGLLERLRRGVYRGSESPPLANFRWEDLVHALAKIKNGVICHITALALYDLTEEIPRQHWIAVRHQTRHRASNDIKVVRMRNLTLGLTTYKMDGITLSIFDRERIIVDAFKYLSIEIAIKALQRAMQKKGSEKIDLEKIRRYAKILRVNITPYIMTVST